MNSSKIKTKLLWLVVFLFPGSSFHLASVPLKTEKPLKEIYHSGKIEFVPVLKITRDSFPEHVDLNLLVGFCKWKDYIYAADARMGDIKILTASGNFKGCFGQKGKGPGDMYLPYFLTFSGNNLLVWESGNRRFSIFNPQGKFIRHAQPKYRGRVKDIKSLDDGRIIIEREASGWVKNEFIQLFGLELFSKEFKYIKELYEKRILRNIFLRKPNRSNLNQPFPNDVSWDVLPGNKIVIGYSEKYQIEILDPSTGATKRFSHTYTPVKVTEADKKFFFDSIISSGPSGRMKRGADRFTRTHTKFPEYKPAFKKIITDCQGNILVFLYTNNGKGESMLNAKCFDAFDADGNFINHVKIVSEGELYIYKVISEKENVFWAISESADDDMDSEIIKYKVQ